MFQVDIKLMMPYVLAILFVGVIFYGVLKAESQRSIIKYGIYASIICLLYLTFKLL